MPSVCTFVSGSVVLLAAAAAAAAGPVTINWGSFDLAALQDNRTVGGSSYAPSVAVTQFLSTSQSASILGTSGANTYSFTHGTTWSNLRIDMDHTRGSGDSVVLFGGSFNFTIAAATTYDFTGLYDKVGTEYSNFEVSLFSALTPFTAFYQEIEASITTNATHVLDNSAPGGTVAGSRTGVIGAGDWFILVKARISSDSLINDTADGDGYLNFHFGDNPVIPLPTGAAMAIVGMGAVGLRRRR